MAIAFVAQPEVVNGVVGAEQSASDPQISSGDSRRKQIQSTLSSSKPADATRAERMANDHPLAAPVLDVPRQFDSWLALPVAPFSTASRSASNSWISRSVSS